MKKYFITIIFLAFAPLPIKLQADNHTEDQHRKIQQIQNLVHQDLMTGDVEHARNRLDEAASNFHSEEIELTMIQTLMQAGEYRHALSAAAHTQAEHQDSFDTTLLYAWLLAAGGQMQPAKNLILSSLEKNQHPTLVAMLTQINGGQLDSRSFKPKSIQLGPVTDTTLTAEYKLLANGVFINTRHVITSRASLAERKNFLIRNGAGRIFKGSIDETFIDPYLARLTLENSAPIIDISQTVDKTPFPGVPIYTVGFTNNGLPQWPQLSIDILGSPIEGDDNLYSLNSKNLDYGTGIYSLAGTLIGVVVSDRANTRKVRMLVNELIRDDAKKERQHRLPVDQFYEKAFQNTAQLFSDN